MTISNDSIWKAGAFDQKRGLARIVSGRQTVRWKKLVSRVDAVLSDQHSLIVIVPAMGSDPRNPSPEDLTNAKLAGLIVSKQSGWRQLFNHTNVYLSYLPRTRVDVSFDARETEAMVKYYFANSRADGDASAIIPTSLLSYLLSQSRTKTCR